MAKATNDKTIGAADKISAKAATKAQAVAYIEAKIKDKTKTNTAKSKATVTEIVCAVHGVTEAQYAAGKKALSTK